MKAIATIVLLCAANMTNGSAIPPSGDAHCNTEKSKFVSKVPTGLAAQVALGGIVGGVVVLGAPLVLTAVGFSSVGPVAGTVAAKCMAGAAISGGIKAGSTYALIQSATMTGAIITGKNVAIGSVVGAGLPIVNRLKNLFSEEHP